jgi:hypothetical protein
MQITRLVLYDDVTGRRYVKTRDGTVGFVKRRGPTGRFPRKRLERHKAAEVNRQLLRIAVVQKVETPRKKPASFNKLYNAEGNHYMPLNVLLSRDDPEGIVIFGKERKKPIGTISLEWFDHLIERLVEFRNEYIVWKEKEKKAGLHEES